MLDQQQFSLAKRQPKFMHIQETEEDKGSPWPVSYTHLRAHETVLDLVCRLLLEKKKNKQKKQKKKTKNNKTKKKK